MMHLCKKLLEYSGVNPERLRLEWISAAEGVRFAEIMNDFTGKLRELGPICLAFCPLWLFQYLRCLKPQCSADSLDSH